MRHDHCDMCDKIQEIINKNQGGSIGLKNSHNS